MTALADVAHFDALHAGSDDPWGVRSRWYELRKRALLLAALPREHYRQGFEPGCSVGGNSRDLAARCDALTASDASAAAISRAQTALKDVNNLTLQQWAFPARWPDAAADLVVVAELAYYLPPNDFQAFLHQVAGHMLPGGHLVMCHWRAQVADAPSCGDAVHAEAHRVLTLQHVGGWCDEDMRIDVWQHGGATSVAAAGGAQERLGAQAPAGKGPR